MKRTLSLVCVAALCGVLFAGCGAQADTDTAETLSAQTQQTVTEETGTAPVGETPADGNGAAAEEKGGTVLSPDVNDEYLSPLVTLRADPYLYKYEGTYYFTGSYPEYDRIELTAADSVNGIAAAVPKEIWHMDQSSYTKYVWAPELHYIMGEWVIYFAYSQGSEWDIKACALRCKGDDPMHDEWEYMGKIKPAAGDSFSNNSGMTLDMTVFYNDALGKWFAIWAQKPNSSNLYLAEMKTPYEFANEPILLTKPEYDWEKVRENVNEGPAVLKHAGKIFVSYSAAATGFEYCMGLLEIDACDDPMEIENWTKYREPVFKTDEALKIYGPGHNCFVEGDNGEQLCILHFRNYKDIIGGDGNSLYDFNRHAYAMKITYDRNGTPQFHLSEDELFNIPVTNHGHD